MRKNVNKIRLEGYVYQLGTNERNRLAISTVKNAASANYGKEFIGGDLCIATDEEGLNVITVHFSYVTPTYASGKANATYAVLKKIIETEPTWIANGKEGAMVVRVDASLGLNEYINQEGRLVSLKRLEGSFVTILNSGLAEVPADMNRYKNGRNNFEMDMIINKVTRVEADPERNIQNDYVTISGAVFDFKNRLLPADFRIINPAAMDAFENLGISTKNPYYTHLKMGYIINKNVTKQVEVEGMFGSTIEEVNTREHAWIVTQVNSEPYEFGNPDVMTVEELTQAMNDRELVVAEIRKRDEEYRATKAAPLTPTKQETSPMANIPHNDFKF